MELEAFCTTEKIISHILFQEAEESQCGSCPARGMADMAFTLAGKMQGATTTTVTPGSNQSLRLC